MFPTWRFCQDTRTLILKSSVIDQFYFLEHCTEYNYNSMCWLYVSLGSRVSPSTFGFMFMGSLMLSICSSSCVLYSSGSGVKRVHVVLSGLRMSLFVRVHVCISCRYDWMFALAMFMSLCVDVIVMSSA